MMENTYMGLACVSKAIHRIWDSLNKCTLHHGIKKPKVK